MNKKEEEHTKKEKRGKKREK